MTFDDWKMQFRHRVALESGIKKESFHETVHMIPHDDILMDCWKRGDNPNDLPMMDWDE